MLPGSSSSCHPSRHQRSSSLTCLPGKVTEDTRGSPKDTWTPLPILLMQNASRGEYWLPIFTVFPLWDAKPCCQRPSL